MKHTLAEAGCPESCSAEEMYQELPSCQESLDASALVHQAVELCAEAKGKDIAVLNVAGLTDICEYFIIVSGRSDRQVQGLCNRVIEGLTSAGASLSSEEGIDKGHWVVLDFGEVIMHVFYEPLRAHYDIEGLWAKAPRITELKGFRLPGLVRAA